MARTKEQSRAYSLTYRAKNLERIRAYDRKRGSRQEQTDQTRAVARAYQRKHRYARYGTTAEEIEATRVLQGDACALCRKPFTPPSADGRVSGSAQVDHDHETSRLRGLLCSGCNTGLGKLGDNEQGLLKALVYVRGWESTAGVSEGWLF